MHCFFFCSAAHYNERSKIASYALFLGDLSIFCTESDIEATFSPFGEILCVRIQKSKETSRALSYGFIEFTCETAAVTAMNELNGYVLKGRPLRYVNFNNGLEEWDLLGLTVIFFCFGHW
jgi:RNA recognition motif-containing protein